MKYGIKITNKNLTKTMKCRYISTFWLVFSNTTFVFKEDQHKGKDISTYHLLSIFLVTFIPY